METPETIAFTLWSGWFVEERWDQIKDDENTLHLITSHLVSLSARQSVEKPPEETEVNSVRRSVISVLKQDKDKIRARFSVKVLYARASHIVAFVSDQMTTFPFIMPPFKESADEEVSRVPGAGSGDS